MDTRNLVLLRAKAAQELRRFFDERGYTETFPPELTAGPGSCENIESVFTLDYFGRLAYLSQTSQLYLEAYLMGMALERTYVMFRSFRAERKADTRRLTEFGLFEFEQENLSLEGLIALLSQALKRLFSSPEIAEWMHPAARRAVERPHWAILTYTEASELIRKHNPDFEWGQDFSEREEAIITQEHGIAFVTHYPTRFKFFNMKLCRQNEEIVENCDVLLPGVGESVGGSVRETDVNTVRRRLDNSPILTRLPGVKREDFEWYLELLDQHAVARAGAGIGFERVIQFILQEPRISSCMEFPRTLNRLVP